MSGVRLGSLVDGPDDRGKAVDLDLDKLVEARLLVQANSGGGKSWLLRRLLEQSHGKLQQLVVDVEGEFHTLREKGDYILAARTGGDTLAEPRTAALLARKLLELGVSAVIDIYDLRKDERVRFVKLFLEAVVDSPKKLWHPTLVVVDEAHLFCPQVEKVESSAAVIDLMTRGRKRGFCGVLATQRLAKLHKDAAAEANVKLIGRCGLDVDRKRAADELGLGKDGQLQLRSLEAGHFFGFGPGLSSTVIEILVGPVATTHPKAGDRETPTPPTGAKVKKILEQLADLPKEAEQEARTAAELQAEVSRLKRELAAASKAAPTPAAAAPTINSRELAALKKAVAMAMKFLVEINAEGFFNAGAQIDRAEVQKALDAAIANVTRLIEGKLDQRNTELEKLKREAGRLLKGLEELAAFQLSQDVSVKVDVKHREPFVVQQPKPAPRPRATPGEGGLSGVAQRIVDVLRELEVLGVDRPERELVALLAGYANLNSKGFANAIGALRSDGSIDYPAQGVVCLTENGRAQSNEPAAPRTSADIQNRIVQLLGGASSRILQPLIEAYPQAVSRDEVAAAAGYGNLNSKGFANALGRLRSLGFVVNAGVGFLRAADVLFLPGDRR